MASNNAEIEKRLWDAADELRANSQLKASEYSVPVLGLIFLRYADHRFAQAAKMLKAEARSSRRRGRAITRTDYHARNVLYLPDEARFSALLRLPEGTDLGGAVNAAMKAIEQHDAFNASQDSTLIFGDLPFTIDGDDIAIGPKIGHFR